MRRELSRLKDILGEEILRIDRQQVGLDPQAGLWLDVTAFRTQLKEALHPAQLQETPCRQCHAILKQAVETFSGEFMAGFNLPDAPGFDDWQFFEGEELRLLLADALQRLIHGYISSGEYAEAIPYARRWLSLDVLHEPAHRQLMRLYAWSGQHAAAMRQYQECQHILQEELGLAPDAETQVLYQAIKSRRLELPVGVDVQPSRLQPPARSVLDQSIHFCTSSDGVRLAYAVVGQGPVLVKAANWLSHLEYDWSSPVWRHWLAGLAENHTLVRYDERGCGLSDWNVDDFSLDAWVLDL